MRARIDAVTRALHHRIPRTQRGSRPRVSRSTFVPVRDESLLRSLSRG